MDKSDSHIWDSTFINLLPLGIPLNFSDNSQSFQSEMINKWIRQQPYDLLNETFKIT